MQIRITFTVLAAVGLLALGCNPTLEGEQGNLEISYEGTINPEDDEFAAIAVGGKVDYYVGPADPDEERTAILQTASSSDPSVLEVTNTRGTEGISEMTLSGVSAGAADITVDAEYSDGSAVSDVFPLEAKEPDAMTLDHTCGGSADVAGYLASNDGMYLDMEMFAGERRVVGYDYYPVGVSPSSRVSVGSSDRVERLPLETPGSAGEFTVSSDLDDTELTGRLVERSAIDELVTVEADYDARVDSVPAFVDIIPVDTDRMVGGEPLHVCQAGVELEASTSTPDICNLVTYQPSGVEGASEQGVEVEGLQPGTCQVEVSMANASGVTGSFEVSVE